MLRTRRPSGSAPSHLPWRASDRGLIAIGLEKYLELLEWTVRQIRAKTPRGSIPSSVAPILDRLGIRAENWLESVEGFDRRFGHIVAPLARLREAARRAGPHCFLGVTSCAAAFT